MGYTCGAAAPVIRCRAGLRGALASLTHTRDVASLFGDVMTVLPDEANGSTTRDANHPLVADPRRQAVSTLKGYAYQVWRTLLAWVTLPPETVLHIEGAEDFDVLRGEEGVTVQVKDLERNVTLASEDVVEAIIHFWEHRHANPETQLQFRFITTAARGAERGASFGTEKGLDYWDRCRRPSTDLRPLRDFLSGRRWPTGTPAREALAQDLTTFIKDAPDGELRSELIARISWDTGSDTQAAVEGAVEQHLIVHGNSFQVHPSEAVKVVPHLLKHVWEVACRSGDRRLLFVEFLQVFQEATSVRVSYGQLQRLIGGSGTPLALALNAAGGGAGGLAGYITGAEFDAPPPLRDRTLLARTDLVCRGAEILLEHGVLLLTGSTGMGKSVLALAIAGGDAGVWRMLDCRGLAPDELRERLQRSYLSLNTQPSATGYLLDDLSLDTGSARFERALAAFIEAVRTRGGRVIATSQTLFPAQVIALTQLEDGHKLVVPPLEIHEIVEMALLSGCKSRELAAAWATITLAGTAGHPQLVHARMRNLQGAGWPEPDVTTLLEAPDLERIRREARRRLEDEFPSDDARDFVYRLSIFSAPFSREHALALSRIEKPGEVFDRLTGPWIEPVGQDRHRLSPLLSDAAVRVYAARALPSLHREAAWAILSVSSLTGSDFAALVQHALFGDDGTALGTAIGIAEKIPEEEKANVALHLLWMIQTRLEPGDHLYPGNPITSLMLRRLQFRFAVALQDNITAARIATAWAHEADDINRSSGSEGDPLIRALMLGEILTQLAVPLPISSVLSHTTELLRLIYDDRSAGLVPMQAWRSIADAGPGWFFFQSAVQRCTSATNVAELLGILAQLPTRDGTRLFKVMREDAGTAADLMARAALFLAPADQNGALAEAADLGIRLGLSAEIPNLVAAAYRALAMFEVNTNRDHERAFVLLDEAEATLNARHPLIGEYRARTHSAAGNLEQAVETWSTTLAGWSGEADLLRAFAYRDAMEAAGRLGAWETAADMAAQGKVLMRDVGSASFAVGIHADQAFALWKSGDRPNSVSEFAAVLEELTTLPDPREDLRAFALHKFVGHQILWLLKESAPTEYSGEGLSEPVPGMASSPVLQEEIRTLPLNPIELTWSLLAQVEFENDTDAGVWGRFQAAIGSSPLPAVRFQSGGQAVKRALRSGDMRDFVRTVFQARLAMSHMREQAQAGTSILEPAPSSPLESGPLSSGDSEWCCSTLLAGMLTLIANGSLTSTVVSEWRQISESLGLSHDTSASFFGFIHAALARELNAYPVLVDADEEDLIRQSAALAIAAFATDPDELMYAHLSLFGLYEQSPWRGAMERHIERIVARSWMTVARDRRFTLLAAFRTAPQIEAACADTSSTGLKKVARILDCARTAVTLRIPQDMLQRLRSAASA
jgi:hypothetical protein